MERQEKLRQIQERIKAKQLEAQNTSQKKESQVKLTHKGSGFKIQLDHHPTKRRLVKRLEADDVGTESHQSFDITNKDAQYDDVNMSGDITEEDEYLNMDLAGLEQDQHNNDLDLADEYQPQQTVLSTQEPTQADYFEIDPLAALMKKTSQRKELPLIDHSQMLYEPFRRDFYVESPEIQAMTKIQVKTLRAELDNIKCRGLKPPKPIRKWTQCGLPTQVHHIVVNVLKYAKPTPIQAQAIPAIMSGRDVLGVAKTGSGKTMTFLLPMFRHIKDQRPRSGLDGPIAIIIAPTHELAQQTFTEAQRFAQALGIKVACAYGGDPIKENIADMKRGVEALVATPGRMIDLLCANSGRVTNLSRCTYFVMDEVDRCFDLGFEQQVLRILANLRPDAQRIFFSATFPKQMEALTRKVLTYKPLEIIVGAVSVVCSDVEQHVELMPDAEEKFLRLLELLGLWYCLEKNQRCLIFVDKQENADNLLSDLFSRGYRCLSLHGGKDQMDRTFILQDFKNGKENIMIATSIAARGLDVKELNLVINYDCPNHAEDYVHRLGRTGRAGNKGVAYTFILRDHDAQYVPDIVQAMAASGAPVSDELKEVCDDFFAKVARGEAQLNSKGFGGKGLERIEKERTALKHSQLVSLGFNEESDDSDNEQPSAQNQSTAAQTTDNQKTATGTTQIQSDEALIRAQLKAKAVAQKLGVSEDASRFQLSSIDKLLASSSVASATDSAKAETIMSLIYNQLRGSKGSQWLILDLEDFSQLAKHRATSREVKEMIREMYAVNISIKKGISRLQLVLDGQDKQSVQMASAELKRILAEATSEAIAQDPRFQQDYMQS